jgi:hypothetical protein
MAMLRDGIAGCGVGKRSICMLIIVFDGPIFCTHLSLALTGNVGKCATHWNRRM